MPENNNVYLIQLVYAIITTVILGANEHNFTLTSILLYIAPFLIDLTQVNIKSKSYGFAKRVLKNLPEIPLALADGMKGE